MTEYRLIPYQIEAVAEQADQVPEGVLAIEAPSLWQQGEKGEDIVVAIIDTGVDKNHPDLKDRIIGGRNFTSDFRGDPNNFHDNNGHGTHVAGIIAASYEGNGIVGVAPNAKLLILKVLGGDGSGSVEGIVNAINYAIDWKGPNEERVRVINMSLGGPDEVPDMQKAIKRAVDKQIPVVIAAGNEGDDKEDTFEYSYPGNYNEVIEVAASTIDGQLAYFSNNNDEVDVIAPGVNILSTYTGGRYARLSGTSMATPHVAGAIALLIKFGEKQFNRSLTEAEIYAMLVKRTVPLGYRASSEGHGLIRLAYMDKLRNLLSYIDENF